MKPNNDPENLGKETAKGKGKSVALTSVVWWFREAVSLLIWTLFLVQLLLVDLIGDVVARSSFLALAFRFRLLFLLGTIAILWLVLGNRKFKIFCGYILAYPFVVVCWHIPRLLFKNWAVVVAFLPAVHSIITSFRAIFISFVAALVSAFLIALASERYIIAAAMAVLGIYFTISSGDSGSPSPPPQSSLMLLALSQ